MIIKSDFSKRLQYLLMAWPIFWVAGIDQFGMLFFVIIELSLYINLRGLKFSYDKADFWLFILCIWWLTPILWVENWGVYLKSFSVIITVLILHLLIINQVKSFKNILTLLNGLKFVAIYISLGTVLFFFYASEFRTILGYFLPSSLLDSNFFHGMGYHSLGVMAEDENSEMRVKSILTGYSSLSMICLMIAPVMVFLFRIEKKEKSAYLFVALFILMFFTEIMTKSRLAILALLVGMILLVYLESTRVKVYQRGLIYLFSTFAVLIIIATGIIFASQLVEEFNKVFLDFRAASSMTRLHIYASTIASLPEHWIIGWGHSRPIEGMNALYSMGTHSSILGMLYQHGVVGLIIYVMIWVNVWRTAIGLYMHAHGIEMRLLSATLIAAYFMLNIRELGDIWWWDQLLCITVVILWGIGDAALKINQRVQG
ncbi:MAG: hypothetical protein AUK35_03865 [Zetaproteobacteria bacterium CG2_30_46_52]|nr:MAG: hypothetical protein AUK35_03865 [Zetaproteobacteria bacterium CG2_30_46_52]